MFLTHLYEFFVEDTHDFIAFFSCEFFAPVRKVSMMMTVYVMKYLELLKRVLIKYSLSNYCLSSPLGIAETQMSFGSLVIAHFCPECMIYLYLHRHHTFIKHLQGQRIGIPVGLHITKNI